MTATRTTATATTSIRLSRARRRKRIASLNDAAESWSSTCLLQSSNPRHALSRRASAFRWARGWRLTRFRSDERPHGLVRPDAQVLHGAPLVRLARWAGHGKPIAAND